MPEGILGTIAGLELAQHELTVRGFYLVSGGMENNLDYLMLESRPTAFSGFVRTGTSLYALKEDRGGNLRFAVALCPSSEGESLLTTELPGAQAALVTFLPTSPGQIGWGPTTGGSSLVNFVATPQLVSTWSQGLLRGCSFLTLVPLSESRADPGALLSRGARAGDSHTITFPTLVPAVNALYAPAGQDVRGVSTVALQAADLASGAKLTPSGAGEVLTTPAAQWAEAAQVDLPLPPAPGREWARVSGNVQSGLPGLCIRSLQTGTCLDQRQTAPNVRGPYYLPIPPHDGPLALYIDNEGLGGPARLLVRSITLVAPAAALLSPPSRRR